MNYSALISACATAGKWQEALDVFNSMKQAAVSDPDCNPNTITYSSLISACAAGSRLDKALQVYDEMQEAGLQPDHITYSTLISAYEKAGDFAEALALLDKLHEAGGAASADTYVKIMQYLAGKQLWNRALEVFLELQLAGMFTICTAVHLLPLYYNLLTVHIRALFDSKTGCFACHGLAHALQSYIRHTLPQQVEPTAPSQPTLAIQHSKLTDAD